jgi:hypothetical protein
VARTRLCGAPLAPPHVQTRHVPVVTRVDGVDEPSQSLLLLAIFLFQFGPKRYNIHSHVILLELLAESDERV